MKRKPSDPISLPQPELATLAETFRLMGDPTRLSILLHCIHAPKAVSEIAESLGFSQSLVSHHLRLLRGARLVAAQRQAKQVFYQIADDHVSDILSDMITHIGENRWARP